MVDDVQVDAPVDSLLLKLVGGWEPVAPTFAAPTQFIWDARDLSDRVSNLVIDGDLLDVKVRGDDFFDEQLDGLYGKSFDGRLADGTSFHADHGSVDMDGAVGRYWSVGHIDRPARLWVATVSGLASRWAKGNLFIQRQVEHDGQRHKETTSGYRFVGGYTYYVFNRSDESKVWFIVVDAGAEAPTRAILQRDMLAMQFVLGRPFRFDVLHGVDEGGQQVATIGGSHGRSARQGQRTDPPAPLQLIGPCWAAPFFEAISNTYRQRPELRLHIPLAFYLDALASHHVEGRYLYLHVALEAFAYWLLEQKVTEPTVPLVDKVKWKAWLKANEAAIKGVASPGMEATLFNKITSVPARRASSRVVQDAFALEQIKLTVTPEMAVELDDEGRGKIVHTAVRFEESQVEIDAYLARIALVRTILVGLIARVVEYDGAIAGWTHQPQRDYDEADPTWWPVSEATRQRALVRYRVADDVKGEGSQ